MLSADGPANLAMSRMTLPVLKRRSLLAMPSGLFSPKISLPKLIASWVLMILLPALLLGLAPLVVTAWLKKALQTLSASYTGVWPLVVLAIVVVVGWFGGRRLFRICRARFLVAPFDCRSAAYALCREGLRHVSEVFLDRWMNEDRQARLRAACAAGAGVLLRVASSC